MAIGLERGRFRERAGRSDGREQQDGTRRFVTIQAVLREWLLPLRKHRGHVVPDANFRKLFEEAREAAGIAEWPDNALRHSFASYHLAHFKDAKSLALEMGHMNSGTTFAHYQQLVRPNEAARYWSIRPAMTEERSSRSWRTIELAVYTTSSPDKNTIQKAAAGS